jgi:hypothetical protein
LAAGKVLPIDLAMKASAVGILTLKNRTLTSAARAGDGHRSTHRERAAARFADLGFIHL